MAEGGLGWPNFNNPKKPWCFSMLVSFFRQNLLRLSVNAFEIMWPVLDPSCVSADGVAAHMFCKCPRFSAAWLPTVIITSRRKGVRIQQVGESSSCCTMASQSVEFKCGATIPKVELYASLTSPKTIIWCCSHLSILDYVSTHPTTYQYPRLAGVSARIKLKH